MLFEQRFIEEAESMLAGGVSPGAAAGAAPAPAHTPGVIGAQEVYRSLQLLHLYSIVNLKLCKDVCLVLFYAKTTLRFLVKLYNNITNTSG